MTEIRTYDYVNHAYDHVRDLLRARATEVFRSATRSASRRAESLAAELRLDAGAIDVATEIDIAVQAVEESTTAYGPTTLMRLTWQASRRRGLFPLMNAVLAIYPLTRTETQLDFQGEYDPPLGALGTAIDAVVGRRIAEACVQRFVADIAHYLRDSLHAG